MNYREYVIIRLREPLKAGVKYKSSIHICQSYQFEKICTDIGMYFSKEQIYLENNFRIKDVIPQVQSSLDSVFSDSTWHKIEGGVYC